MEKILILVIDTKTSEDWMESCIDMLHCFKPSVQIISPIDRHAVTRIASNEGIREAEVRDRMLHETYMYLYHLEDTFNKQGLQVNIAAREMSLPEDLITELRKKNAGMLVVVGKIEPTILESLYSLLHIPILLLPHEE
jgi:hypothetical protein